ncbi:hypothetical protein L581_3700 [Serratia fonticola AU-AP2C]|nr:hypothetical protein L581_3700 [Serratia fonticola AU-AP2C]
MKLIKNLVMASALSLVSFGSFAQSITATASTLDEATAKIAAMAKKEGASYKITGAFNGNFVYMTAKLVK